MANYNFKEDLYPSNITYEHARYAFIFFTTKEHTKEFFKYFYFRLREDYKSRKNNNLICAHVLKNNNDRFPLIDFNYNFFIEVLGEWIEHYSSNKKVMTEYRRFTSFEQIDLDENVTKFRKYRDYKIELSTKEKVLFDYSYSGWRIMTAYYKNLRFDLIQVLFNNILGKHTYVSSYQNRKFAKVVTIRLVKDLLFDDYVKFPAVCFVRDTLAHYLSAKQMKKLHEMSEDYEILSSEYKGIEAKIKKLEINEEAIRFCNIFDMLEIEKSRDEGDGKFNFFDKNVDDISSEKRIVIDENNDRPKA